MDNLSTSKRILIWLVSLLTMIICMVFIGGLTRLTNSGLSIVEWKPITGIIPPLNINDWIHEFNRYKDFPEYKFTNFNISLDDFKFIYYLEYIHRLFARITGIIFIIPFLYFYVRKQLDKKLIIRLITIPIIGAIQAYIGWYMVKSGLIDLGKVSQYRLTLHLCFAFIIYSLVFWNILILYYDNKIINHTKNTSKIKKYMIIFSIILILQIILGGFTAGTDAGLIYNEWPFMGLSLIPSDILIIKPNYRNFLENPSTIQFMHRTNAILLFIISFIIYLRSRKTIFSDILKNSICLLFYMVILQFILGVTTLIYRVPITTALMHQLGALILLSISINIFFILYKRDLTCK